MSRGWVRDIRYLQANTKTIHLNNGITIRSKFEVKPNYA